VLLVCIYDIWWWAAQIDYGLCGVACRFLLRVLSQYDNSRSVRSFLMRFGLPDVVICWCLSVGGDLFSVRSYRSFRLSLLCSLSATSVVTLLCLCSTCWWLVPPFKVFMLFVASLHSGVSDVSICVVSVHRLWCPSCLCSTGLVHVHCVGCYMIAWGCVFICILGGSFISMQDSSEHVVLFL
jgi:hypothetical protein